ncbi:hypothetical protein [Lacunimicrobium album]
MSVSVLDEFRMGSVELPKELPIQNIKASEYEDVEGNPAILINVWLKENTNPDTISGANILDMKRAIRRWFLEKNVDLFPYYQLEVINEEPAEGDLE